MPRSLVEMERRAQREAIVQGIASLSGALRQRDDGTGAHSERVARIAVRIGATLNARATVALVRRLTARSEARSISYVMRLDTRQTIGAAELALCMCLRPGASTRGQ